MVNLHFNAWTQQYKKPFGAIHAGNEVSLGLTVDFPAEKIDRVEVCLTKDSEQPVYYRMEKRGQTYKCHITITTAGCYYYFFQVVFKNQRIRYLGKGCGGEGKECDKFADVKSYQLTVYASQTQRPSWYRDAVVYQIFPDSFANGNDDGHVNGNKKNILIYGHHDDKPMYVKDDNNNIQRWTFYGGNLKGITQKINYLKQLGVNTIYLNPIFQADSVHRYDTNDFMKIDDMLGTEDDFRELVNKLHANGMHLILDGVFNHVGQNSRYFNRNGQYGANVGAYRNRESPYYSWFSFIKYPDKYKSWWGVVDLPTVDHHNQHYQQFIYGRRNSVLSKWNDIGVDGWRLDVADELSDEFLTAIRQNLNHYSDKILIGEVWEDASNKHSYGHRRAYTDGGNLDGVMNYPVRKMIINFLTGKQDGVETGYQLMTQWENYPRNFWLNCLNNIGTHDTKRIRRGLGDNIDLVKLAFRLLFCFPGIPCIYYGDEAGLDGGVDPDNRRFYPWGHQDWDLVNFVSACIRERKKSDAFKDGNLAVMAGKDLLGVIRYTPASTEICLVNRSDKPLKVAGNYQLMGVTVPVKQMIADHLANLTLPAYGSQLLKL